MLGLVRSAAAELAAHAASPSTPSVPGYVDTPMTDATVADIAARTGRGRDEAARCLARRQPIGRLIDTGRGGRGGAVLRRQRARHRAGHQRRRRGGAVMSACERINPDELARPSGFAHAVVGPPARVVVYLAGQTALDADGRIVGDGVVEQFEQALANLLTALRCGRRRTRAPRVS